MFRRQHPCRALDQLVKIVPGQIQSLVLDRSNFQTALQQLFQKLGTSHRVIGGIMTGLGMFLEVGREFDCVFRYHRLLEFDVLFIAFCLLLQTHYPLADREQLHGNCSTRSAFWC